jgi:two-component system, OmpR family, phosphate regulon sensor histidine kinase PhoR
MLWPILALISFLAAVGSHLYWRRRHDAEIQGVRAEAAKRVADEQLLAAQRQAQQDAVFNSMAEGVILLDEHGRIQLANRSLLSLFSITTDICSRTLIEAFRLHELADLLALLGPGQRVVEKEIKVSRPADRWFQVNGACIFDAAGQRKGSVLVFHDLTRIKQLESTRKEFVANVSHELRTPLSLIQGYVETLIDGAKDDPETAGKFLKTIERNAQRLRLLIEDLLVISELESGRLQLDLQPVALRTLAGKVIEDYRTRAEAKSVRILDQTPDLTVRADGRRIEQVLGNLVDNAIKYGKHGGTVSIGGRALPQGQAEVFVHDDGPGIPEDALTRVFERFYRIDKARSRDQGGTGLGLAIVKHLVQVHGGQVWVESQPGCGATFYFTLREG